MTASAHWLAAAVQSGFLRPRSRGRSTRSRPATSYRPARGRGDHGEGVISAAIAVLIMAFLGALMWVGFQQMWIKTEERTNTQIDQISTNR